MHSQLCLGTAQFGLDYGITNTKGKIEKNQVNLIIERAINKKIKFFDTASSYGESQKIIGNKLKNHNVNIISKFKSLSKSFIKNEDIELQELEFKKSLKRLKTSRLDSFLLHNPSDLKKGNSHLLINWLKNLKERGLIKRFGISIYDEKDLEEVSLKDLEVIQMPISIYDQRLLKKDFIKKLQDNNISIHVRSIFLQGLLLQKSEDWPKSIEKKFIQHHQNYEKEVYKQNLTLLDSSISFIKNLEFPELILFGITNISELNAFLKSWESEEIKKNLNYSLYNWSDKNDIDPRTWING